MFKESFEVVLADDEWSRRIHYQLRYQVFCVETGFEDPAYFPEGEEKDEWDDQAAHFLVRERGTDQWVAAMRMVFPRGKALPMETRTTIEEGLRPPADQVLEISRLCMIGHYRRRAPGQVLPCETPSPLSPVSAEGVIGMAPSELRKRLRTAEILRVLLDAAVAYSHESGVQHWYMFITKALSKVIAHILPLELQQVGQPAWHRGERYPFLVNVEHLFEQFAQSVMGDKTAERRSTFHLHSELITAEMPRAVGAR